MPGQILDRTSQREIVGELEGRGDMAAGTPTVSQQHRHGGMHADSKQGRTLHGRPPLKRRCQINSQPGCGWQA